MEDMIPPAAEGRGLTFCISNGLRWCDRCTEQTFRSEALKGLQDRLSTALQVVSTMHIQTSYRVQVLLDKILGLFKSVEEEMHSMTGQGLSWSLALTGHLVTNDDV